MPECSSPEKPTGNLTMMQERSNGAAPVTGDVFRFLVPEPPSAENVDLASAGRGRRRIGLIELVDGSVDFVSERVVNRRRERRSRN